MLLLPSRKSGSLNNPDMVLSQIHSFMQNANCEDERESNNNTLITEKDVLRTPPHKCRFGFEKIRESENQQRLLPTADRINNE